MNKLFLLSLSLLGCLQAAAQTTSEALRYSTFDVLGTARSAATAGAMSSLGGDFSVLSLNPAGVATYRGSEFTVTPGYFRNTTDASLSGADGSVLSRSTGNLLLANLGFVIASRPRNSDWKTSNFAIGVTKVADYHQAFEYSGSEPGSITDRYRELADGILSDDLFGEAQLAFDAGAIYDFEEDGTYESDFLGVESPVLKRQSFESSGYNTELLFAYGANYREVLQFGLGIGVPILSYEERKVYREDDRDGTIPFFNDLKYEESLSTSGSGFNFKAGVIVKPSQWINIGVAYHSRTRYALTDNYSSSLEYDYTDLNHDGPILAESPPGTFRYNLRTPRTVSGGIGVVIAKSGFMSAEIQYKDFGGANFNYSGRGNGDAFDNAEREVNASIESTLSDAMTIRTGAEIALGKFRLRGGVEFDQSPYVNDDSFDPTFNAGIGFRGNVFFVDLAFQHFTLEEGFLPYVTETTPQPLVIKDIANNRLLLTMAYRWK